MLTRGAPVNPKTSEERVQEVPRRETTRSATAESYHVDAAGDIRDGDGWRDDQLSLVFTNILTNATESKYENAKRMISPEDPRMKEIESAL